MELQLVLFFGYAVCLLTQAYYSWAFFYPLSTYVPPIETADDTPAVSVVIAARNEEKNLSRLLEGLIRQDYPNFDVIIVNDRSTDSSGQIINSYASTHNFIKQINIDELPEGWNGKKNALFKGIDATEHDIILLTDADCVPKSDLWIKKMLVQLEPSTEFILGFSPYQEKPGFLNHFIRFETLWTGIQYLSMAIQGNPYMGVGRNLLYRKSVFQKDGFSDTHSFTGGDDDLLVNKQATGENTKISIEIDAQTISVPKNSWSAYFRQKTRHLAVGKHYRQKDRTRIGLFALCSLFGWILLFFLIFTGFELIWILALFAFRSTLFYSIFTRIGRKLGVRIIPLTLPLLDLFYNFFYLVVGLRALTAKRIKWS